ncbi:unnamed protein product [Hymenolepis diminuta]|uniref:Eukaryotic translation initiation factor 3 subunit B n=1 Tax=Hymenolepis diminuta TaxID=6216 RepID=A0A0R3SCH9_HYMDI|nr:unnamed protein product [Hymenolepis diminuta]VUZ54929.1 unnamed protein product [Hymenolepis diminuta]
MAPIKDSELMPDIMEREPVPQSMAPNVVIVDGCPVVPVVKVEALTNFILKKFSAFGNIIYKTMPLTADEQSKGYMFIIYDSPESAAKACKEMDKTPLDKAHTFRTTLFSDYSMCIDVGKAWVPPEKKPYQDVGNPHSWLLNEFARDQYCIIHQDGEQVSIYWHSNTEEILIEERERWSDSWIKWSPRGTYLATMHQKGIALWGGDKFSQFGRYVHPFVTTVDFSPNERFMVTLSQNPESRDNNNPVCDMIVWDIRKGTICRNFSGAISSWPAFKWSHDDAYMATVQVGKIYIYETESFSLVDGKPIIAPVPINSFEFSPTENILAYWTQETNSTPSRVALISIPSRKELCTKNLFQVASITLNWHPQGDYLCIQVERYNKKKVEENHVKYLGTFINFEIVRLREKLYPIDQIAVNDAASVTNFAWEPTGNRFAYIAVDNAGKLTIPLYSLTKSGKVAELATFERGSARINCLKWSPKGSTFVIANLNAADAFLEFIDANDCQALGKVDHPMASEIHWDGTGRYVASVVTSFRQKTDNGVWFWNSVGRSLYQKKMAGLQLFAWRPFPPSLLTPEQINKIKKDLGTKYSPQFDAEDKMLASKASREVMEHRQTLTSKFNAWRTSLLSRYSADKAKRDKLRGTDTEMQNSEEVEEELEFLVKTSRDKIRREA